MANSKNEVSQVTSVEEVIEERDDVDRSVDFADHDERRIATASKGVPGAGGIEITKHKKVKLANGLIIENN